MKTETLVLVLAALLSAFLPHLALAQPEGLPVQWAGAGVSFNQYASPQINGVAAYAHRVTSNAYPTYSFTAVNFLSLRRSPFQVMTTTETGIAQCVGAFGPFTLFGLGTAGIAIGPATASGQLVGTALSFSYSGGVFAQTSIGKGWTLGPMIRIINPSISERQWALGLMLGWGE